MLVQMAQNDSAAIQGLRRLNMHLLQQLQAKPPPASTLGAHMLKLVDPVTGKPMSDKQLLGEITIMYVAGGGLQLLDVLGPCLVQACTPIHLGFMLPKST